MVAGMASVILALSACADRLTTDESAVLERERREQPELDYDTDDGYVSMDEWELFEDVYREEFGYYPDGTRSDAQAIADEGCDAISYMSRSAFEQFVEDASYAGGYDTYEGGFIIGGVMATACMRDLERAGLV